MCAAFLWADNGTNLPDPWTDDPGQELSWGSAPRNLGYTFYDGNYLNYLTNPVLVQNSRINIVQNTATAILNSIEGINVGIMRFNGNDGGPVLLDLTDLDLTSRGLVVRLSRSKTDQEGKGQVCMY